MPKRGGERPIPVPAVRGSAGAAGGSIRAVPGLL